MRPLLAVLLISSVCLGQTAPVSAPPPSTAIRATASQMKYLRFLLLNVGSVDHSPDAVKSFEGSLVLQFGLNVQESAVIHSAGQNLNTVLAQLRQSSQTVVAGKTVLTAAEIGTLENLNAQREQAIASLANQILNSVSPLTAARLMSPGNILMTISKAAK